MANHSFNGPAKARAGTQPRSCQVDKLSCRYNILWNSFKRLTVDYSADGKAKLYHDTATRVYSLGSSG